MKLPCALIRDLLPLYHDNVCAPETSAAVEEHLAGCEPCQQFYHDLQDGDKLALAPGEPPPQAASLRKVKKKIRRKNVAVALCVLLLCGVPVSAAGAWLNSATVDLPADTIKWVSYFENVPPDAKNSLAFANDDETGQGLHHAYGAFKVVFSDQDAAYRGTHGLNYKVTPFLVDGKWEWVMFMSARITKWDAMWEAIKQNPPVMYPMGIWINSDWAFWDLSCGRYVEEGLAEEPADEDKDCFISRVYFLPDYDHLAQTDGLSPEDQENFLEENAVLLWTKTES